jgi:cystathionine gamma-synthase
MSETRPSIGTLAVWGGELDREGWGHATQVPLVQSASFGYPDLDEWLAVTRGEKPGHNYSRSTNPTVAVFEDKVRQLEGAEDATSFATGMAAVSNTLYALLAPGDRVVSVKDSYGGTSKMFLTYLPKFGIAATLCDTTDADAVERELASGCRLLYLETPTNPTLKVLDLPRLIAAGHRAGAIVVVDNTFATPVNTNPIALGADLVLHSATKFLGGHEDALGGVVVGRRDLVRPIYHFREITGASLAPGSAYLLNRGLKTLALRVRHQNRSALEIARWLEGRPEVERVFYPGLESNPGHAIAARQMRGFGAVMSFSLAGGEAALGGFFGALRYAHCAPSLGAVCTLMGPPATTSHVELSAEERAALGIPESLIRCSIGIEDTEDLIADIGQALRAGPFTASATASVGASPPRDRC